MTMTTSSTPATNTTGASDGLAPKVAEVEAARDRLGHDLDLLHSEVRTQMGRTVERIAWKLVAAGTAIAAAALTRKGLTVAWRKTIKRDPPKSTAGPGTGWGEAIAWTGATAVAIAVARLVAERGTAAGWQRATGHQPPGLEDT